MLIPALVFSFSCLRAEAYIRSLLFFFQAEDGIRCLVRSRGLGDVYKRQLQAPGVHLLGESSDHLSVLGSLLASGQVTGARIPDARVAAICLAHGVDALWSADRDFSWFPQLRVVNPLVDPHL